MTAVSTRSTAEPWTEETRVRLGRLFTWSKVFTIADLASEAVEIQATSYPVVCRIRLRVTGATQLTLYEDAIWADRGLRELGRNRNRKLAEAVKCEDEFYFDPNATFTEGRKLFETLVLPEQGLDDLWVLDPTDCEIRSHALVLLASSGSELKAAVRVDYYYDQAS